MKKIVNLTTFPQRKNSLCETIKSITYNQTIKPDEVNLFLNKDYKTKNELPNEILKNEYINRIQIHNKKSKDRKDLSRFYLLENNQPNDSFVFFIDDDIKYPNDYIEKMIKYNQELNSPICVHGSYLIDDFKDYFSDRKVYHFQELLHKHTEINIPGSGTFCYNTNQLKLSIEDFEFEGGSDFDLYKILKLKDIKCFSVKRNNNWLQDLNNLNEDISIRLFNENKKKKLKINEYLKCVPISIQKNIG